MFTCIQNIELIDFIIFIVGIGNMIQTKNDRPMFGTPLDISHSAKRSSLSCSLKYEEYNNELHFSWFV